MLIFRDIDNDDALTEQDLTGSIEANEAINIHWSGLGTANWSAGCQVIAGCRYINHQGMLVDCLDFAAAQYSDLEEKTRAAYNMFLDLVTTFAPNIEPTGPSRLIYTLIHESDLARKDPRGDTIVTGALNRLPDISPEARENLKREEAVDSLVDQLIT